MTEKEHKNQEETEKEEAVKITKLQDVTEFDPTTWPSGDLFVQALKTGLDPSQQLLHAQLHDPNYWQACARWAMLTKFGYLDDEDNNNNNTDMPTARPDFIAYVSQAWLAAASQPQSNHDEESSNDLHDFFRNKGKSRNRNLKFHLMQCPPGCQFNLHAHPNLEVVYCVQGALHEVRMQGPPLPNQYDPHPTKPDRVKGPNLSMLQRQWKFGTLREGAWLVNEAGSVHKSFTATSGNGCILVTLWSGSHADILEPDFPADPNIQQAVDQMDQRLAACNCSSDWKRFDETFLPASERRQKE